MKEKIDEVNRQFLEFYRNKGYKREESVDISSGIDKSVTYIGSGISVLKPLFLNNNIHSKGNFIKQKAIRTQALKKIYNTDEKLQFSSFFDAMCVLVNYDKIDSLVLDSFVFFQNNLKFKPEEIMLRIKSDDIDLMNTINGIDSKVKIEVDSKPDTYYRHKYGLADQGIYGRNMNFAFLDKSDGQYKDVGNFIIIESNKKKYGVELALGAQAVIMRRDGIETSTEASYIADIINLDSIEKMKYAECLMVVANLHKENVMAIKEPRYPIYLYKKYLRALKYWKEELEISKSELILTIEKYLKMEYNPEFEYEKPKKEKRSTIEFER